MPSASPPTRLEVQVRRAVKYALRRGRSWLAEPDTRKVREASRWDAFSVYPELNRMVERIRRGDRETFRPAYAWCTLHAAHLAKTLGIARISVVEFGVAGGNGLVALERAAGHVEQWLGVGIDVYGFDTGVGLPKPIDWRDAPNLYREGDFPMHRERLEDRLNSARLFLGDVRDSVPDFLAMPPSPLGFIAVDLDLYSSTVHALRVLLSEHRLLLPRVHCYFDDILGYTYGDHNGERLAIDELNAASGSRKLYPIYGLRHFVPHSQRDSPWPEQVYLAHILDHPLYGEPDGLTRIARLDLDPIASSASEHGGSS
jgi:hypothetical protein